VEYKSALKIRGNKLDLQELVDIKKGIKEGSLWSSDGPDCEPFLFPNWANNGYRLPTKAEFESAARGGLEKNNYSWGADGGAYTNHAWDIRNAGGTTHPVGQLQPNGYGLYDIQGNVFEASWSVSRQRDPDRDYWEDINNPKCGRYTAWQKDETVQPNRDAPLALGDSFFWSTGLGLNAGVVSGEANNLFATHNASDCGFRVVRCDSNVHPTNGLEDLVVTIQLTYDTNEFTDLQGQCAQGNVYRNGQYNQHGVESNAVVSWMFNTGGPVKSHPVIVNDVVYVGGGDGFYAIDALTGIQRWEISIPEGVESSACVVDGVVYFGANDKKLYSVNVDGTVNWSGLVGSIWG